MVNFNARNHTDSRVISLWLHEIPSDAGGGSEATLFAPFVYEQCSPRRRKDQDRLSDQQQKYNDCRIANDNNNSLRSNNHNRNHNPRANA